MGLRNTAPGPHNGQPILTAGEPLTSAEAVMVLTHGRGAGAQDILGLAHILKQPGLAYLAPHAARSSWYPLSFLAPIEHNEPHLSSALAMLDNLVALINEAGLPSEKVFLLGFSQGACLSLEFVARHPRRYGGVAALSGGLIGPAGTPRNYEGSLEETPVFLGCSDVDFHIPLERVQESTAVMRDLGGQVMERIYPGMGHLVNDDELAMVQQMLAALLEAS